MCGIACYFSPNGQLMNPDAMKILLLYNEKRGRDSFGFASKVSENFSWNLVRKTGLISSFLEDEDLPKTTHFVAHTRQATQGGVTVDNCHPFVGRNGEDWVIGVHNGTLSNFYALKSEAQSTATVDSEVIFQLLAKANPEDYASVLSKLDGAYAVVFMCRRTNKVFVARNGERPLFYGYDEGKNGMYLSSTKENLKCIRVTNIKEVRTYALLELVSVPTKHHQDGIPRLKMVGKITKPAKPAGFVTPPTGDYVHLPVYFRTISGQTYQVSSMFGPEKEAFMENLRRWPSRILANIPKQTVKTLPQLKTATALEKPFEVEFLETVYIPQIEESVDVTIEALKYTANEEEHGLRTLLKGLKYHIDAITAKIKIVYGNKE